MRIAAVSLVVGSAAVVLATLGGLAGTAFCHGAVLAFGALLDWPMRLSPKSLMIALGVSTTIGLAFGFFPARRAARMAPSRRSAASDGHSSPVAVKPGSCVLDRRTEAGKLLGHP